MCERKFLCSGFLSEIQCQRFFRICVGPLTGTVYLWLASSICGGLVLFRVQCTYNTQQNNKKLPCARSLNLPYCCIACSLLLTHAQFYTLFWTNKSHASTLFFHNPPPPICSSTCVLLLTLVLSYQPYSIFPPSGFNEVYLLHSCSLCSQNTPHLRQNARGGVYKKRMETVYQGCGIKDVRM
jgi:hypothetical protein